MYEKKETRRYYGPVRLYNPVKFTLKGLGVFGSEAYVRRESHDTGYPGLITSSTIVEITTDREELADRVDEALKEMGFRE